MQPRYLVAVRRTGYREVRQLIADSSRARISLILERTEAQPISAVMVEAGRFVAADEPGATLSPIEIVTIPGTAGDINRAIQTLPGTQQVDEGTGLFVRGGDFTETRVFLNEALLLNPAQLQSPAGTFVGTFDPFLMDAVYFTSGGFGARYGDALSAIVALRTHFLQAEVDGDRLSREDILDICFLFLIAGLDTVSDSLTCFFAFLAQHPDHRRQIVDDPSVIPNAVEELLRWETPVTGGVPRRALHDVEVCGMKIETGTMVLPNYGAANVDPAEFPDGFDVRFDREANTHIAFGAGIHRCLGSHLARRELRITLREWHRRIPVYGLKPGHDELEYPPGLRSVKNLTLAWPT
jgi:hypothetical protein